MTTGGNTRSHKFETGLIKRNVVFIVDVIVVSCLLGGINFLLHGAIEASPILGIALYLAYFVLMVEFTGATASQKLFGLRTVDQKTLGKPAIGKLFAREVIALTGYTGIGILAVIIFGFYWDKWTGITVSYVDKK